MINSSLVALVKVAVPPVLEKKSRQAAPSIVTDPAHRYTGRLMVYQFVVFAFCVLFCFFLDFCVVLWELLSLY